jgi:hypothetical protein
VTLIDAGAGQSFAGLAVAVAGNEGELFYAQTADGGTCGFLLQHLASGGSAHGPAVVVATGMPAAPPAVAVSSDGVEISACWEDFGTDPNPHHGCSLAGVFPVVKCNSVPVAGTATDHAMDGGYVNCGSRPSLEQGSSASSGDLPATILSYLQAPSAGELQILYCNWGDVMAFQTLTPPIATAVVAEANGYSIFLGGDDSFGFAEFSLSTPPCSGYTWVYTDAGTIFNPLLGFDGGQAFSASGRADDGGSQIGIVVSAASTGVMAFVLEDPATGVMTTPVALNAADEAPLGLVAATGCGAQFWYAYAVDGGDVMAGAFDSDGALVDGGASLVGNLGANATNLSMATSDGGLLLAVGTPAEIGVFFVPCP